VTRPGGFPRIKRPPAAKAADPAVEVKAPAPEGCWPDYEQDTPRHDMSLDQTFAPASLIEATLDFDPTEEEEYDEEGRRLITKPLPPPPRPQPTILHPTPASRAAPPPVRPPGAGLLANNVGAPVRTRPSFLPPLLEPTLPSEPTTLTEPKPPPTRQDDVAFLRSTRPTRY